MQWVHQKCSNKILTIGVNCSAAHHIDGRWQSEVQGGPDRLKVVASFCYLVDVIFASRGLNLCEKHLEEIQDAAAISHIPPPLLQDLWACVQLLHVEPVKLGHSPDRTFSLFRTRIGP